MTDNAPFIVYERAGENSKRIISFDYNEDGTKYVADILESDDDDLLWEVFAERFPTVTHLRTGWDTIEEADCLTLREAAEAVLGA